MKPYNRAGKLLRTLGVKLNDRPQVIRDLTGSLQRKHVHSMQFKGAVFDCLDHDHVTVLHMCMSIWELSVQNFDSPCVQSLR